MSKARLAPGVPADYYQSIRRVEDDHWWFRGMREISRVLLEPHLQSGPRVLDAGCGTGGYLRWLLDGGSVSSAAGVDVATAAVELARRHVPEADLHVAPLSELPFAAGAFDLVVSNDVLQHVDESELEASLGELRRVLRAGGTLLLRTNGSWRLRPERSDWRAYDPKTLGQQLAAAGFAVERVTYANCVPSLWGRIRGRVPHAPTNESHGIPSGREPRAQAVVGLALLRLEARLLTLPQARLPYGHTLFAVSRRV